MHKSFPMLAGKRISEESSCLDHLDSWSMTSDNSKDFSIRSFDCVCFLFRLFKTFKLLSKCIIMHYTDKNWDDRASLKECLKYWQSKIQVWFCADKVTRTRLKISIAEKVVVRTRRAGKIIQKAAFYHFNMKAYFLLKISQRMRYVRLVVQTFREVPYRKSYFSFASIKRFTRICDTSDRKLPEGVQRSSNITDKEMLTRPSFWTPKWDNEPQNSQNMVAFQEIIDFKRNPWIFLQILDKSIIFFFWEKLSVKRSRLSTSFFAQELKTYIRLDRPRISQ